MKIGKGLYNATYHKIDVCDGGVENYKPKKKKIYILCILKTLVSIVQTCIFLKEHWLLLFFK